MLLVDDSAVIRGQLAKIIGAEPGLEVVGRANNGAVGVEKAAELKPDVIVMDIEMPVMTGLEAVVEIRKRDPKTPIIMFSTLTANGADITLEALSRGATDYATKPTNAVGAASALEQVREDLVAKIRQLGGGPVIPKPPTINRTQPPLPGRRPASPPAAPSAPATRTPAARPPATGKTPAAAAASAPAPAPAEQAPADGPVVRRPVVAPGPPKALIIGSSTGGPSALEKLLPRFTKPLSVPILLTQHMPPTFTSVMAERLDKLCSFPVLEAVEGQAFEAGSCYIAPGGVHLTPVKEGLNVVARFDDGPKVSNCKPSVTVMFDAAAEAYDSKLLVCMLTGMGDDGFTATERLAAKGLPIVVQDEATSVVWGMPGVVARAGLATQVLPLDDIAPALLGYLPIAAGAAAPARRPAPKAEPMPGRAKPPAKKSPPSGGPRPAPGRAPESPGGRPDGRSSGSGGRSGRQTPDGRPSRSTSDGRPGRTASNPSTTPLRGGKR
ncbi:MAG: chemotaxis-specific protein-glutamate methyltransferase CheB [Actinomycetota bacterium]